jgi:hypothetical protein
MYHINILNWKILSAVRAQVIASFINFLNIRLNVEENNTISKKFSLLAVQLLKKLLVQKNILVISFLLAVSTAK